MLREVSVDLLRLTHASVFIRKRKPSEVPYRKSPAIDNGKQGNRKALLCSSPVMKHRALLVRDQHGGISYNPLELFEDGL